MKGELINFISSLGLAMIGANLLVFAILERLRPAALNQPLSAYFLNLRITALYLVISNYYWAGLSAKTVAHAEKILHSGLINLQFNPGKNPIMLIGDGILIVIIADFFYYWFHRTQHMIPALWSQHKIHHLDEHLNASSTNRHHWLEELFRIPFMAVPLAVLFTFDPMPAGIIGVFFSSWGYFIHSNLRIELGPLTRFIAGPQVHRIHHSRLENHYNKNFAAFFPVWDILFNTYYHPQRSEFPPTGITGEALTKAKDAAFLPFYIWAYDIKSWLLEKRDPFIEKINKLRSSKS